MLQMNAPEKNAPRPDQTTILNLVLYPHRSLSPRGFMIFMGILSLISFMVGMIFLLKGAWPVMGFFGLDVALVYFAFRLNFKDARRYETLQLTPEKLTVERVLPSGRSWHWEFQPYWLRVEMDDPPEHFSQLRISSHGRSLIIGSFLSPQERLDLAGLLHRSLLAIKT